MDVYGDIELPCSINGNCDSELSGLFSYGDASDPYNDGGEQVIADVINDRIPPTITLLGEGGLSSWPLVVQAAGSACMHAILMVACAWRCNASHWRWAAIRSGSVARGPWIWSACWRCTWVHTSGQLKGVGGAAGGG